MPKTQPKWDGWLARWPQDEIAHEEAMEDLARIADANHAYGTRLT